MKRTDALAAIRVAAYHDDDRTATRIYVEHRMGRAAFDAAISQGRDQRKAGMRCNCWTCTKEKKA